MITHRNVEVLGLGRKLVENIQVPRQRPNLSIGLAADAPPTPKLSVLGKDSIFSSEALTILGIGQRISELRDGGEVVRLDRNLRRFNIQKICGLEVLGL